MGSHYEYFKQQNWRQFSLTRVQPYAQAPSALKSTRDFAIVFVRAKAKHLKAKTCEAYIKREKFVCAKPIINSVVMIVLTIMREPWNVLLL